jgi:hypothetical protein
MQMSDSGVLRNKTTTEYDEEGPVETYTEVDADGNTVTRTKRTHAHTTVTSERVRVPVYVC